MRVSGMAAIKASSERRFSMSAALSSLSDGLSSRSGGLSQIAELIQMRCA
ncbi:MAG: hypothetical protein ACLUN5_02685 [Oscillospiraceae bacterium]